MISRRTLLRGAGASVALPLLEAMLPSGASAQAQAGVRRLLAFFVPNGIRMDAWTTDRILAPLRPYRDRITVVSGLVNRPGRPEGSGHHAAGTGAFLTATHILEGEQIGNGTSIDQVVARAIAAGTRFPSLVLGAERGGGTTSCDPGYACAYTRSISWIAGAPAAKEIDPQALFDRLFADADPRRRRERRSVLDFVRDDAARLRRRIGAADARRLDEYLSSVRALERRLEAPACDPGDRPARGGLPARARAMCDLMALAFRCDLTRVITFMLGNGRSGRPHPHLGIGDSHHELSHHAHDPERLEKLERIDTWEVEQLAYLLGRLAAFGILDSSVIVFGSELADGDRHEHEDLPVLLAGAIGSGRDVQREGAPWGNLMITLAGAMGVAVGDFGDDGTEPLGLQ